MATSPADTRILPTTAPRSAVALHLLRVIALGCVVAAVLGSVPLQQWAQALPDSRVTATIQDCAAGWNNLMQEAGATWPYTATHATIQGLLPRQ
jgi:hypothetical protein